MSFFVPVVLLQNDGVLVAGIAALLVRFPRILGDADRVAHGAAEHTAHPSRRSRPGAAPVDRLGAILRVRSVAAIVRS